MKMRYLVLFGAFVFWLPQAAAALEKAAPVEQVRRATAEIDNVVIRNGILYGEVVNRSNAALKDVRLLVRHVWLWDNEYRPGHDIYSAAEYLPIEGIIAPGESVEFSYAPALPAVEGGHFETKIIVGEFTELPTITAIETDAL